MSRAFVKEDSDAPPPPPAEIPVSDAPNFVTPRGLDLIEAAVADAQAAIEAASDEAARTEAERQSRYWLARRATARLVTPPADPDQMAFGMRVRYRDDTGAEHALDVVGEDEADPAAGRIACTAPLARALIGAGAGDAVPWRDGELIVLEIAPIA